MKNGQVTIKDIAKALNISPSTVSRALKNHPDISEATKKAVVKLANELDYQPNSIALSLRKQKTNIIGVIVPELVHHFFSTIISGIEDIAYSAGYNVMICQSNESYSRELTDTNALVASRVDGLLMSVSKETKDYAHLENVIKRGIPLVFFDRAAQGIKASKVLVDDHDGAFKAVEHLIEMGAKRIAHLAGPKHLSISKERISGYLDALKKYNLPVTENYILYKNNNKETSFNNTLKLLSLPEPPDAIFATNDIAAIGAMMAVKKSGFKIPEDISVLGFSNWQLASLVEPPLSSVYQPGFEMGQLAAKLLLEQIDHKDEDIKVKTEVLKTKLIIRESSDKSKTLGNS